MERRARPIRQFSRTSSCAPSPRTLSFFSPSPHSSFAAWRSRGTPCSSPPPAHTHVRTPASHAFAGVRPIPLPVCAPHRARCASPRAHTRAQARGGRRRARAQRTNAIDDVVGAANRNAPRAASMFDGSEKKRQLPNPADHGDPLAGRSWTCEAATPSPPGPRPRPALAGGRTPTAPPRPPPPRPGPRGTEDDRVRAAVTLPCRFGRQPQGSLQVRKTLCTTCGACWVARLSVQLRQSGGCPRDNVHRNTLTPRRPCGPPVGRPWPWPAPRRRPASAPARPHRWSARPARGRTAPPLPVAHPRRPPPPDARTERQSRQTFDRGTLSAPRHAHLGRQGLELGVDGLVVGGGELLRQQRADFLVAPHASARDVANQQGSRAAPRECRAAPRRHVAARTAPRLRGRTSR